MGTSPAGTDPAGPLTGTVIGVTGARKGAEFCAAVERRGGVAVHGPTIEPDQPAPDGELLPQLHELLASDPDWFVANTGTGVRLLADLATRHGVHDEFTALLARDDLRVVARGAKAVGGLRGIGVTPEHVSDEETDASVVAWLADVVTAGDHLAVQYSARTRRDYQQLCDQQGTTMQVLRPYRSGVPRDDDAARELVAATIAGDLDVVVATSAIAVDNLVVVARRHGLAEQLVAAFADGRATAAAIGQVTAEALRSHGIEPGIIPERHRTGSLLTALEDWATAAR